MGIINEVDAGKVRRDALNWLRINAYALLTGSVYEYMLLIIVTAQLLYGTYFKFGKVVKDGYYVTAKSIRAALPKGYAEIAYTLINVRNMLCRSMGSDRTAEYLDKLRQRNTELEQLLKYMQVLPTDDFSKLSKEDKIRYIFHNRSGGNPSAEVMQSCLKLLTDSMYEDEGTLEYGIKEILTNIGE